MYHSLFPTLCSLVSFILLLRCKRFCGAHLLLVNPTPQNVCTLP
ncbi:Putative tail fiber protein [Legionella pneumophila subsp. pneumophila LPE509]|nr:Putative tail fiber protein [Legionella pneumophila subsp. pneumophila LPE509]